MDKKEIEITVDKNNKVDLHDFIEMKIKYEVEYQEKDKEIERLNKSLEEQRHFYLEKIQQKENIIKEVREYCDKEIGNIIANFDYIDTKDLENIRKILDKGSDKE